MKDALAFDVTPLDYVHGGYDSEQGLEAVGAVQILQAEVLRLSRLAGELLK